MAIEDEVKPTRKDLMEVKDRIELSEQGHETLEKKRDGLIMEFMEILEESQDVRENLETDYEDAQKKINKARALDGDVAVRGAASALAETPQISLESKNIMGVVVPQIESSKVQGRRRARVQPPRHERAHRRGGGGIRGTHRDDNRRRRDRDGDEKDAR